MIETFAVNGFSDSQSSEYLSAYGIGVTDEWNTAARLGNQG